MATTNGIMKSEFVPAPMKTVVTKVKEIQEPIVCGGPRLPSTRFPKTFEVEYPSIDPNVMRVRDPLPFPEKLHDLIGWTDAFVDRIAIVTQAQEQEQARKVQSLDEKIEKLNTKLATQAVELEKARDAKAAIRKTLNEAEAKLKKVKAESDAKDILIDGLNAKAIDVARENAIKQTLLQDQNLALKNKNDILIKKVEWLTRQLDAAGAKNKDLIDQFDEEHKLHLEDHTALEKEHKLLKKEEECRVAAENERDEYKDKLAKANIEIDLKGQSIIDLNKQIADLFLKSQQADTVREQLEKDLEATKTKLAETTKGLQTAEELNAELVKKAHAAQEQIAEIQRKLQDALADIETKKLTIAELTAQKEKAESNLAEANTKIKTLEASEENLRGIAARALKAESEAEALLATKEKTYALERTYLQEQANQAQQKEKDYEAISKLTPDELATFKSWKAKGEELERKLKAADTKVAALEIPKQHPKVDRFNILSVEYGGKSYVRSNDAKDIAAIDKLYNLANSGKKFKVDNNLFPDPWQGYKKSFSITYQADGRGAPLHLFGKEHGETQFTA